MNYQLGAIILSKGETFTIEKFDEDKIGELWETIIKPQYFYPEEIYYDFYGEMLPFFRPDNYEQKVKDDPAWLKNIYGERPNETNKWVWEGILVRDDKGVIAGWLYWNVKPDGRIDLKYIVINKTHMNKGLGRQLMRWFITICENNNKHTIYLAFNYHIRGLKEFYAGLGFRNYWGKMSEPLGRFTTWKRKVGRPMVKTPPVLPCLYELFL